MKLNKIKKLCLESKRFCVVNGPDGVQWFTDRRSLWLCLGIRIRPGALSELFGLDLKQQEKCIFNEEDQAGDEYGIAVGEEEPVLEYEGDVWEFEQRLMALRGGDGMLYVPRAFAEPCQIESDTRYALRILPDADGEYTVPMVAVYNGMICEAMLPPIQTAWAKVIGDRMAKLSAMPAWEMKKGGEKHEVDMSRAG